MILSYDLLFSFVFEFLVFFIRIFRVDKILETSRISTTSCIKLIHIFWKSLAHIYIKPKQSINISKYILAGSKICQQFCLRYSQLYLSALNWNFVLSQYFRTHKECIAYWVHNFMVDTFSCREMAWRGNLIPGWCTWHKVTRHAQEWWIFL